MAKTHAPRRAAAPKNEPGDTTAQPSAAEQAEGVTMSAAEPVPFDRAEFDSLKKIVHQLAIKVGV